MSEERKTKAEIVEALLEIAVDLRDVRNKMLDVVRWEGDSLAEGTDKAGRLVDEALRLTQLDLGAFTFYNHVDK